MKTLIIRTLSGAVYVALIVAAIFAPFVVSTAIFAVLAVLTLLEFRKTTRNQHFTMRFLGSFAFGSIYVIVPFASLLVVRNISEMYLLAVFVIIWTNDSFAYLVGSACGKHKMCPQISPKKSWEGLWGGLIGALIAGVVFSKFVIEINLWQWLVFALIISVFGTLGDLFESKIKRTVGVKDSGNLIPGHGGLLDRLDSLLFATPPALLFLAWVG